MSAVIDTHGHGHAAEHGDHAHPSSGLMRWVTTTNHKDIGTMYLWFSFTMLLVGGALALTIRAELFEPGLQIVTPEFFNQLTTMHGLISVFSLCISWAPPASWARSTSSPPFSTCALRE